VQSLIIFISFIECVEIARADHSQDYWIGGLADPSLKRELRDVIRKSATGLKVEVSGDLGRDDPFSGTNRRNIGNRLAQNCNGIQIKMAKEVRSNSTYRDKIAEAVKIFSETKI
jgi:hypothetical protein